MQKISIDKIKIQGVVRNTRTIQKWYDAYCERHNYVLVQEQPRTLSLNKYQFAFTLTPLENGVAQEGVLYFAWCWNGSYSNPKPNAHRFVIEYNPNKVPLQFIQDFKFFTKAEYKEILSLDLAFDYNVPRHFAIVIKGNRSYMAIGRGDTLTEYLGYNNRHARLKVYDKAKERGLETDLTRVEVSITEGLSSLLLTFDKRHNLTTSTLSALEKVTDVLACVSFFDPSAECDPLTRLLATATPTEREIYINCCSNKTRAKYRNALRSVSSPVEFSAFEIYDIIIERLAKII